MDQSLRYEIDRNEPEIETIQDFSDSEGILKLAEKCNGSGDCRKSPKLAGLYALVIEQLETKKKLPVLEPIHFVKF